MFVLSSDFVLFYRTPGSRKKSKRNTPGSILRKISLGNSKTGLFGGQRTL